MILFQKYINISELSFTDSSASAFRNSRIVRVVKIEGTGESFWVQKWKNEIGFYPEFSRID